MGLKTKEPVAFIIYSRENDNKIYIDIFHAQDYQIYYELIEKAKATIHTSNHFIQNIHQLMPILTFLMTTNQVEEQNVYQLNFIGPSINRLKDDSETTALDVQ